MSGFLWHSSKWAHWFSHFIQYRSGLEVLACSLDTGLNYVTTMLQLHPSLNLWKLQQIFRCILIDRYVTPAVLSWTQDPLLNFLGKMSRFVRCNLLIFFPLWPFCVVMVCLTHKLPAWLLALTLHMWCGTWFGTICTI